MKVELESGEIGNVFDDYISDCEVGKNTWINVDIEKPDGTPYYLNGIVKFIFIEEGKTYLTKSRGKVRVKKSNTYKGYHYKFTVDQWIDTNDTNTSEVWSSRGEAYHYDCGYNIVKEVI